MSGSVVFYLSYFCCVLFSKKGGRHGAHSLDIDWKLKLGLPTLNELPCCVISNSLPLPFFVLEIGKHKHREEESQWPTFFEGGDCKNNWTIITSIYDSTWLLEDEHYVNETHTRPASDLMVIHRQDCKWNVTVQNTHTHIHATRTHWNKKNGVILKLLCVYLFCPNEKSDFCRRDEVELFNWKVRLHGQLENRRASGFLVSPLENEVLVQPVEQLLIPFRPCLIRG